MTTRQPFGIRAPPIEESAQFLRNHISGQPNSFSHPDPPTFDIIHQGHQIYNPLDDDIYLDREVEKILENADNTINNCAPPPGFDDFTFIFNESPPSIDDFSNNHSSIGNEEYCLPPPGFENCSFSYYDYEPENEGYFSTPPGFENVTFDYYDSRSGMDEYGSPLLYCENPAFNHVWNGNEDYYESFLDFQESTVIFNESSLEFEKYSEFFTLFSEVEPKEPQGRYVRPATCKIIDLQESSTQTEPNIVSKPWNGLTTIKNIIDAVYQVAVAAFNYFRRIFF
ncbi:hypothetical protein ACOME3_010369 [Neoechinorhynchus agilis]